MSLTTNSRPAEPTSSLEPPQQQAGRSLADPPDPVHERFGDDTLRLLSPILGLELPPDLPEFAELIEHHPIRSARPSGIRFPDMLEVAKWYCDAKGGEWRKLGEQIDIAAG